MVAIFITLDILELRKLNLNLNEYLTLMKFQHERDGQSFPFDPDPRYLERLLKDEFIKEKVIKGTGYVLGPAGEKVFQGDDLFEEFYATFPSKVPVGNNGFRPVSTGDVTGVSAKVTRGIWNRVTKNKPHLQRRIIDNLKRELDYRKSDGSIGYLQGIDTWLHQATWEKWDSIPDKRSSGNNYVKL
jgi:hypothetical protein